MKNEKLLEKLFTTVKKDNGDEIICFTSEALDDKNTELHTIQQIVSDIMYKSNLSHNFSYEIAERAVDVLLEVEDWDNDDAITEAIDSNCPIYTSEIMGIYQVDHWTVDEAIKELGNAEDSEKNALQAWFIQIQQMTSELMSKLKD